MTTKDEFEKKILENLDMLGENIKKSDKVKGRAEAYDAYKKARKLLK